MTYNCLVSHAGGRLAGSINLEGEMLVVKIVKRTAIPLAIESGYIKSIKYL